MKRSTINRNIAWAIETCERLGFHLPSFAYWAPEEWEAKKDVTEHMLAVMQGWDVTDYNSGDFDKVGAVLFTLRNGSVYDASKGTPYCEKIIVMKAGQVLPFHFHYSKTEDIINRTGGTLCVRVYASKKAEDGYGIDTEADVCLRLDGVPVTLHAGDVVEVHNGDSITLFPYIYHEFWAKEEDGDLIIGEVSSINDDSKDNHFAEELILDPIEEDEAVLYRLCSGYVQ